MSKVQVDTIDTRSGTSTMQIGSTNTTTINLGVSGDTVNIPSGVTIANAGTATGFGESNTPAFRVRSSAGQSVSNTTWTKIEFDAEDKDTDSAFDLSNERFTVPSGEGGLYSFQWSIENNGKVASNAYYGVALYKNGASQTALQSRFNPTTTGTYDVYNNGGGGIVLAAGDYVELFFYQNTGGSVTLEGNYRSWTGFKVTE